MLFNDYYNWLDDYDESNEFDDDWKDDDWLDDDDDWVDFDD
jgi:hypothetical protein